MESFNSRKKYVLTLYSFKEFLYEMLILGSVCMKITSDLLDVRICMLRQKDAIIIFNTEYIFFV